jgi:hypothetical protein
VLPTLPPLVTSVSHNPHCAACLLARHAPSRYVSVALPLRLAPSRSLGATPCVGARSWVRGHRVRLSLCCVARVLPYTLFAVGGHSSSCALRYTTLCGLACPRAVPTTSLSVPRLRVCAPQLVHAAPCVDLGASPPCGRAHRTWALSSYLQVGFHHQVSTTHQGRPLALVPARGPNTLPYAKGI